MVRKRKKAANKKTNGKKDVKKLTVQQTIAYKVILSILVYTFFSRMFDLMLPPVAKHSIVVA